MTPVKSVLNQTTHSKVMIKNPNALYTVAAIYSVAVVGHLLDPTTNYLANQPANQLTNP